MRAFARAFARAFVVAWLLVALGATAALAAIGLPERSVIEDRNDTPGRMDISDVRYDHEIGDPPSWRVVTYAEWRPRQIWDTGFVWLELDTRYGDASDYYVLVRASRDRMLADLFRVATRAGANDHRMMAVDVSRPSSRAVAVRVPLSQLVFGEARTTFRWWVESSFTGDTCRAVCFDLAPDDPADAPMQDAPGGPPPA
jgi:hypothetical protein